MDGLWKYYAKWNKSETNSIWFHLYVESKKQNSWVQRTGWWLPERRSVWVKRIKRYRLPVIKWISYGDISIVQWLPSLMSCCKLESYYSILKLRITKFCNSVLWQWLDVRRRLFHEYMNAKTNVMKRMSCCMLITLQLKKKFKSCQPHKSYLPNVPLIFITQLISVLEWLRALCFTV